MSTRALHIFILGWNISAYEKPASFTFDWQLVSFDSAYVRPMQCDWWRPDGNLDSAFLSRANDISYCEMIDSTIRRCNRIEIGEYRVSRNTCLCNSQLKITCVGRCRFVFLSISLSAIFYGSTVTVNSRYQSHHLFVTMFISLTVWFVSCQPFTVVTCAKALLPTGMPTIWAFHQERDLLRTGNNVFSWGTITGFNYSTIEGYDCTTFSPSPEKKSSHFIRSESNPYPRIFPTNEIFNSVWLLWRP